MSRQDRERLADIRAAAEAISRHLRRGTLEDDLVYDAVRVRLIEIGEAVKDLSPALVATEPSIPWRDIARMRDHLAHRYFETSSNVVATTAQVDVPLLDAAAARLEGRLADGSDVKPSLRLDASAAPRRRTDGGASGQPARGR